MSDSITSERVFTDAELLSIATTLLKYARRNTAINDCQCHECSGFKQESGELLELIERIATK